MGAAQTFGVSGPAFPKSMRSIACTAAGVPVSPYRHPPLSMHTTHPTSLYRHPPLSMHTTHATSLYRHPPLSMHTTHAPSIALLAPPSKHAHHAHTQHRFILPLNIHTTHTPNIALLAPCPHYMYILYRFIGTPLPISMHATHTHPISLYPPPTPPAPCSRRHEPPDALLQQRSPCELGAMHVPLRGPARQHGGAWRVLGGHYAQSAATYCVVLSTAYT
jgi:hypothetical protein